MSSYVINNKYDKALEACGNNVVLRKKEKYHERYDGELYIPEDADINCRANLAVVESVGEDVDKTIKVDDVVLYDYFGVYADTDPIVCADARNVIGIYDEDAKEKNVIIPIGDRLLLKPVTDRSYEEDGLFIPEEALDEDTKTTEECVVVGYGRGCSDKFQMGDTLLVSQSDIMRLTLKGEKFVVVQEPRVIAIISRKEL